MLLFLELCSPRGYVKTLNWISFGYVYSLDFKISIMCTSNYFMYNSALSLAHCFSNKQSLTRAFWLFCSYFNAMKRRSHVSSTGSKKSLMRVSTFTEHLSNLAENEFFF